MTSMTALERLRPGDHVCLAFDDEPARIAGVVAYVQAGLREHHKILYYGDAPDKIMTALEAHGTQTDEALASGQLQLSTPQATYLASGAFQAEPTIDGWRHEASRAAQEGYAALRAVGDMSWASRSIPGVEQLPHYEAHVNRVFADGNAMALCLYDRRLFTTSSLQRVAWAHPATIGLGADPATAPLLRIVRTREPIGVRLEGEADMSNRHALRAVLEHLFDDTRTDGRALTVDVAALRFSDAATARILIQTAADQAHRLRVVGCSPAMRRLLVFNGADAVTDLQIEAAA